MVIEEKFVYLQQQNPPREPKGSVPGRNFYFIPMAKLTYTNQPLDYTELVAMMKSRGLAFKDEAKALEQLKIIGYFRLASYLRPMESDKVNHQYKPGSTFENAIDLYYFDKDLRAIVFSAIQSIEIAVRAKIMHNVSMQFGPFWFSDASNFAEASIFNKNLTHISEELTRSKEDFIQSHFSKYDSPALPPAWKTLEVTSFGTLSKLYYNLKDKGVKRSIARELGLPQHLYLESWIQCVAVLRNIVAHHARIWNRQFPLVPVMPAKLPNDWIDTTGLQNRRLYAVLSCVAYLENAVHPNSSFVGKIKASLAAHPNVDVAAMGFPADWENEPLWR